MTLEPCKPHGVRGCLACAVLQHPLKVLSESDPTKRYTLYTGCTCPSFRVQFGRWIERGAVGLPPTCKHIRYELNGEGAS